MRATARLALAGLIAATLGAPLPAHGRIRPYVLQRKILGCCGGGDPEFGVAVAARRNLVLVGVPSQTFGVALLYDRDTGTLRHLFASPSPSADFGRAVAAHGDDFLVAAPDTRAVHLFDATTFALVRTFADPNPKTYPDVAAYDRFASALAARGRLVVAGAPFDDARGEDAGAVYVFARSGRLVRRLDAPAPRPGARFGAGVAVAGDDVVVGASGEGTPGGGAVYVFSARTGALRWSVTAPEALADRLFGHAVAVAGRRVLVGAPCRDGGTFAGAAVLYDRERGAELRRFAAPTPEACDFFGGAVALAHGQAVVAAPLAGTPDTGAVYAFSLATGALRSVLADGEADADLGWSLAVQGRTLAVGAAGEEGRLHVYTR